MELKQAKKNPKDIARYILYRFVFDGDTITNLKMQKVLYYVYAWHLVLHKERCFEEKFQAWPIGPVLYSIYKDLKRFGFQPIDASFSGIKDEKDLEKLKDAIGSKLLAIIDNVYKAYGVKSSFELVSLTHNESPWKNARKGLDVTQKSENEISDEDIIKCYGQED